MKKNRCLYLINLVLGSLSIMLAGCHTQKNAAKASEKTEQDPDQPVVAQKDSINEQVICMYGVPVEFQERPMLKYGVPDGRDKKRQ